ncbi:hypothetical protein CD351_02690 [Erythrobacter sp. KY5]|uniref:hypothetical protein n=1 Tax=Erythrobacter sp. KY5 TaxID=2011159 RepID=UPI000DBF3885|nr:hypothetical protein [Erythrobacter sp. KY5]AWW73330.1 hypothetical protein CD351_02690 [Erythrobacter sp. KY5]
MLVERRRSAFPRSFLVRAGVAWALVSALLIAVNWNAIATHRFPDPDDIMRLLQVRDLIAGQSWFDLAQYRVDAPGGGVGMHWSRLVDLPIVLIILILTPIVGAGAAEATALIAVPLITLLAVILLASRIAWRLMGEEEATLTALVVALSVPVLFQLGPLRVDHHGWQIVCALAAVNGLMARSPKAGGWVIGSALAIWLSISIEGLPLAAAFFAILAFRWLRHRGSRAWLVSAIQALAIVSVALFGLTRGFGDLLAYCDAVSPIHLAMFAWGALVLSLFARFEPVPRGVLVIGFALAGGGAVAMLLHNAPQCATGGGFSALDPVVARYWHANVLEGMPIWRQSLITALQFAVTPLIALGAAINLASRSHDWLRQFWIDYAIILAAAFLVSIFVSRAGAVACALAAAPLAWQLRHWLRAIRSMERPAPRMAAMVGVCCALLPALPAMLLASALPAKAMPSGATVTPGGKAALKAIDCRVQDAGKALSALPTGEFYAPLDIAPELLLVSEHSVIATGHHRGDKAMKVLIETALADEQAAYEALRERGTSYVAICPNLGEARMYSRINPNGFVADLVKGDVPDWMEPIALDGLSGLQVWRIAR